MSLGAFLVACVAGILYLRSRDERYDEIVDDLRRARPALRGADDHLRVDLGTRLLGHMVALAGSATRHVPDHRLALRRILRAAQLVRGLEPGAVLRHLRDRVRSRRCRCRSTPSGRPRTRPPDVAFDSNGINIDRDIFVWLVVAQVAVAVVFVTLLKLELLQRRTDRALRQAATPAGGRRVNDYVVAAFAVVWFVLLDLRRGRRAAHRSHRARGRADDPSRRAPSGRRPASSSDWRSGTVAPAFRALCGGTPRVVGYHRKDAPDRRRPVAQDRTSRATREGRPDGRRRARPDALARRPQAEISEAVALSTCNRTEVYVRADDNAAAEEAVCTRAGRAHRDQPRTSSTAHGMRTARSGSAVHLLRVASSLDAMIVGRERDPGAGASRVRTRPGGGHGRPGARQPVPQGPRDRQARAPRDRHRRRAPCRWRGSRSSWPARRWPT